MGPPHQQQHALSGVHPCHLVNSSTPCLACNPANPQQQHALSGVQPCQPSSTAARPVWRATLPPYQQQHALSGVQPCHINSSTPCLACNPACHGTQCHEFFICPSSTPCPLGRGAASMH